MSDSKGLVVVTGGSKGIGKEIVRIFLENGFPVCTCARNPEGLRGLAEEMESIEGSELFTSVTDMSKKDEVKKFAGYIDGLPHQVICLVNNTGFFLPGNLYSEDEGVLEAQIETNLYSAYNMTRAIVPQMVKKRNGSIFNICSTASITAYANGGSYCISKFAMYGMSKVFREELKEFGIKVTSVLPGATLTASWEGVDIPPDRFMKSRDIAESIWSVFSLSANTVVEEILLRPQLGDLD
jgi:short-subunit dehydrogenase